jgi:hypothetical protein
MEGCSSKNPSGSGSIATRTLGPDATAAAGGAASDFRAAFVPIQIAKAAATATNDAAGAAIHKSETRF